MILIFLLCHFSELGEIWSHVSLGLLPPSFHPRLPVILKVFLPDSVYLGAFIPSISLNMGLCPKREHWSWKGALALYFEHPQDILFCPVRVGPVLLRLAWVFAVNTLLNSSFSTADSISGIVAGILSSPAWSLGFTWLLVSFFFFFLMY